MDGDLVSLLLQNLERLDEDGSESDRQGVYHTLAVFEGLASQTGVAERVGNDAVLRYLLQRLQRKETPVSQNKQYAAEVLQVLLQSPSEVRQRVLKLKAVDAILQLLSAYRKRDPQKDSHEEEWVEDLFDALTCIIETPAGKHAFLEGEGIELMLIMLREGKMSKTRALKVIDHATSGQGQEVCERLVEAAGLKTLFSTFMKKTESVTAEHILGIFAAMLRLLPGESDSRIRTLAKFVEKDFEKVVKIMKLRREYSTRLAAADEQIRVERESTLPEDLDEVADEWLSRRLDAGLYCLQTLNLILAWLVAEDRGARQHIVSALAERDEDLSTLKGSLEEQLRDAENGDDKDAAEMLATLVDCLK